MDRSKNPIFLDAREWLGAFGDIGILIPLLLSLAVVNGVDITRTLALAGVAYILAGLYFRLPVPVQPLKAMAAIALAQGLGLDVIRAASFWMGGLFLLLSFSGGASFLSRFFPKVIVKGLQLGVGLLLIKSAFKLFHPVTIVALPSIVPMPSLSVNDFVRSLFILVLPQIPLTLGNSVFGARDALTGYFGPKAERATAGSLCASIGLMNFAAGALGSYPLCHGSGGVTAHVRLGARTAGATILMGGICLALAFFLGRDSFTFLQKIPSSILGGLLLYVGIFHSKLFLQLENLKERGVAILMGVVTLLTNHLGWALAAGLLLNACEYLYVHLVPWTAQQVRRL